MKKWILIVLALQVLALLSMAGKREWIRAQGDVVYLRTAPVDPRDIFRGDYVELDYDISSPRTEMTGTKWSSDADQRSIYVSLELDSDGVAQISQLHENQPENGVFIKGRAGRGGRNAWRQTTLIRYGIEKYFVEQGSGLELEERRGRGEEWQTAMEVEVALGSDGTGVIRDFRWSNFDVKTEVLERDDEVPDANQGSARPSPMVALSLRNQSDETVRIPDSENHCSFQLERSNWASEVRGTTTLIETVNRDCENEDITWHLIAPGEVYTFNIDFADENWLLKDPDAPDNSPISIQELANSWGYRLVYDPRENPTYEDTNELNPLLTRLRSARFNAWGRID